jgi:trehalose 6-phosphate synthase
MGRLIVVSNRVSTPTEVGKGTTGGLAMALSAALREYRGIWFGWSGNTTPAFNGQIAFERVAGVTVATVDLEDQDRLEYYNGFANKALWPLFHHRVDLTSYERSFGSGYERVNRRFAETLRPLIEPDDFIWVHDYHLIPLARELRRLGVANRIGFFLHIPWPARQIVTTLPHHRQLVEALLNYDLVGFQTADFRDAFAEYLIHDVGGAVSPTGEASAFGLQSRIGAFPIGLDSEDFIGLTKSAEGIATFEKMRQSQAGRKMIVGVDRLDYSKGLQERFEAYEQFLGDNPERLEQIFFLQIATPSRDEVEAYQEIRGKLDSLSGRINGNFSTIDWVPLRYVNRAYRRDELAGIYRAAHVGLVTPLRDGMNLVAKEYVAAQDPEDPGVLILSRFAGAARQLTDALIVNPYSREDLVDSVKRALSMPLVERRRRWQSMIDNVRTEDVIAWRESFVAALREVRRPVMVVPTEAAAS